LEGALAVVTAYDGKRLKKGPFHYKVEEGRKIQIHCVPSDEKEARVVRSIVQEALPSRDVLILVPHRGFGTAVAKALADARIPFSAPPSVPSEGLPAAADLARWLRDDSDSIAFRKCLSNFMDGCPYVPSRHARKSEKKKEREDILRTVSQLWQQVLSKAKPSLWQAILAPTVDTSVLQQARHSFLRLRELATGEHAPEFAAAAIESLMLWKKPSAMLDEIEQWVSSFERASPQGHAAAVRIMTFQGAKGLQARVVCVLGVEEGTIPRNADEADRLAEEARLLYVSATRAVDELHLFFARKRSGNIIFRNIYHSGAPPDLQPSRFLSKIGKDHSEARYHRA
jgi:superfamily I DNA/RNA helicase